ncbi:MAG: PEP-CTERM sorting domain-containing protein [Abditibacteriota bacterium]|nr:PEP-CTERM sorting domain-containing protein [Abditibacteriota bacterium]
MKKILVFIAVLCAICGSAFAAVTISDWSINYHNTPVVYDGLITDIAPTGFNVTANSEMWDEENRPMAAFISRTVSPGWTLFFDPTTYETSTFQVRVTGFDDLIIKAEGTPVHYSDTISVYIFEGIFGKAMYYQTPWRGDGVYTFGYDEQIYRCETVAADWATITFLTWTEESGVVGYYLGDNTAGTIEFILPENEVPEPSSLLALAFGGAGTAIFAIRRRKQR